MAGIVPKLTEIAGQVVSKAGPAFKTFMYYAKDELAPPKMKDLPEIKNSISCMINGYKKGNWKNVTVRQAFLNTLVTAEVVCWFYIGECIGKRGVIGYKVR